MKQHLKLAECETQGLRLSFIFPALPLVPARWDEARSLGLIRCFRKAPTFQTRVLTSLCNRGPGGIKITS